MALQVMKIYVDVTTTVNVEPENTKFFYVTTAPTDEGNTLSIDATNFFLDDGNSATELPVLDPNNSYYNVYVNGVLQMEGITTYTSGANGTLEIDVPLGSTGIPSGVPVILEVINFTPDATSSVET